MRRTIKEDRERIVLHSELLNDNTLLELSSNHGYMDVGVRFIESPVTGMKEHILLHMDTVKFMKHKDQLMEINEGKDAIAIFEPTGEEGYFLDRVYDTEEHEFAIPEFVDIVYSQKFPNQSISKTLQKEKRKGGVKWQI